jgi:hypothetical protein
MRATLVLLQLQNQIQPSLIIMVSLVFNVQWVIIVQLDLAQVLHAQSAHTMIREEPQITHSV